MISTSRNGISILVIGLLIAFSLSKEDIWVKEEKFDPLAPFEFSRVILYSPKGCTLDTMPGVRLLILI